MSLQRGILFLYEYGKPDSNYQFVAMTDATLLQWLLKHRCNGY